MTKAEQKAIKMISNLPLEKLLDQWELTTHINNPEISIVRGWLMDELEKRNSEAFNKWLDNEFPEDSDLRSYMTK